MAYFQTENLSVGYNGKILIRDITISLEKGKILTLIGANGAGKSTILKTITRQLAPIGGVSLLDGKNLHNWSSKALAQQMAVVLTDRIRPELMTCAEVVAMGRYPYTNLFGKLTEEDKKIVQAALKQVHAEDLSEQDFATLSDGQRQRILLARAICQQPKIIILDEPTAYLDIRHKIELLEILRRMAHEQQITVIMSLHEIDLAMKASDLLLCVQGDTIAACGTPDQLLQQHTVERLYGMENGSFNLLFGSVELPRPIGKPKTFVLAGNGSGIAAYRALQKKGIPFASGVLFENDVDFQVAAALSDHVIAAPAFEPMTEAHFQKAAEIMLQCQSIIDCNAPKGSLNFNQRLLSLASEHKLPVQKEVL